MNHSQISQDHRLTHHYLSIYFLVIITRISGSLGRFYLWQTIALQTTHIDYYNNLIIFGYYMFRRKIIASFPIQFTHTMFSIIMTIILPKIRFLQVPCEFLYELPIVPAKITHHPGSLSQEFSHISQQCEPCRLQRLIIFAMDNPKTMNFNTETLLGLQSHRQSL